MPSGNPINWQNWLKQNIDMISPRNIKWYPGSWQNCLQHELMMIFNVATLNIGKSKQCSKFEYNLYLSTSKSTVILSTVIYKEVLAIKWQVATLKWDLAPGCTWFCLRSILYYIIYHSNIIFGICFKIEELLQF